MLNDLLIKTGFALLPTRPCFKEHSTSIPEPHRSVLKSLHALVGNSRYRLCSNKFRLKEGYCPMNPFIQKLIAIMYD